MPAGEKSAKATSQMPMAGGLKLLLKRQSAVSNQQAHFRKEGTMEKINVECVNKKVTYLLVQGEGTLKRPAQEVWIVDWPEAEIRILWPEGMTPKEAILAWAIEQMK